MSTILSHTENFLNKKYPQEVAIRKKLSRINVVELFMRETGKGKHADQLEKIRRFFKIKLQVVLN